MSFSGETKNYLCSLSIKSLCCKKSMLFGMLMLSGIFHESRVKLVTENEATAAVFSGLMKSLIGLTPNTYVSSKKTEGKEIFSYKLTVAARSQTKKIIDYFGIESLEKVEAEKDIFVCKACASHFLRGAFLSCGTVSDPEKSYHADFRCPSERIAKELSELLVGMGIPAKSGERLGNPVVYIKDSESIGDFLTLIGAQRSALDIIESKIVKEVRNNENRKNNFETANLYKTTGCSGEQIRAIEELIEKGLFESLPEELKYTASLRIENPFSSLAELAALHDPPVSKSGLNHRLKKILEIAGHS